LVRDLVVLVEALILVVALVAEVALVAMGLILLLVVA
jgi:hypothetical protein